MDLVDSVEKDVYKRQGLGSIPSVATLLEFLSETIVSGLIYDVLKFSAKKGSDFMKKEILLLGLGVCGDMV